MRTLRPARDCSFHVNQQSSKKVAATMAMDSRPLKFSEEDIASITEIANDLGEMDQQQTIQDLNATIEEDMLSGVLS